ncbi:hypothetical protein D3C77_456160 [compost metagenome]
MESATLSVCPGFGKAHFTPGSHMLSGIESSRIPFGLRNSLSNVDAFALGFDYSNRHQAPEQDVVCLGFKVDHGPLGNRLVLALLGARTFAVGELQRVGFPAGLIELLVDENTGQVLIQVELFSCLLGFLGKRLSSFGL